MRLRRRSIAVACAVAVTSAASSLALATEASAFRHPSPGGRCRVGVVVAPRRITAGEPVTIFGRLVCRRRANAAGQVVRLFQHVLGTPGFSYVQSTTTDAQGFYQFQNTGGVVETNRIWHVRSRGAESPNRGVRVAAQVALNGPPEGTQILTGVANRVTFTGTVTPADVGARVVLQRQNALTGNEWHRIDSGVVEASGAFSITHTFIVPGDANLRVLVLSQGRNVPSPSDVLSYEISQAQNPALTINASADPISYGQSVTISGVLAGETGTVALEARTVHEPGWMQVAQVATTSTGAYTFPPQTPVNSTFYRVKSSGAPPCPPGAACPAVRPAALILNSSAVLYEAVRFVLTAQVSATTVLESQTLTFTGAVAPSSPGHVIYLERQNASDHEFHVVQVGTLGPGSTFSIPYQVYSTGTDVFRVKIPGGPDNGGAVSQLFTIQVNPAPAATLTPEAPSNSSGPAEGTTSPSEGEREGEERTGDGEREAPPHPPHAGHHHR
jgi:hypothetical protein